MRRRVPRLALFLLERALPREAVEFVVGDLVEEYVEKRRSRLWLWRQVLALLFAYATVGRSPGRRTTKKGRPMRFLDPFLSDLRYAGRSLRSSPGFALAVIGLVGLGFGANAAMFHWVESVLLAPLPYPDPSALVRLLPANAERRVDVSPPDYFDLREQVDVFTELGAYWSPEITVTGAGEPEKLLGATVSHTLFDVLGVRPSLGRGLHSGDDVPGSPLVTLLSDGLWRRRFGSDPSVLGTTISLNGLPAEIVGVAPPGLDFPREGTELWIPLRLARSQPPRGGTPYRGFRILEVVGRLREGVSIEEARAAVASFGRRLEQDYPDSNRGVSYGVTELKAATTEAFRPAMLLLWGAIGLVFLVVCFNAGGLFLTRAAARRREMALRAALGATPLRVYRQLLAESFVLVVAGGALGLILASWATRLLSTADARGLPAPDPFSVDFGVLLYVVALVAIVGLGFGAAPTLVFGRRRLAGQLGVRSASGGGRGGRVLVVVEIALALVLLVAAALFARSFVALRNVDPGFREAGVYYGQFEVSFRDYPETARRAALFERVRRELAGTAGVHAVSLSLGIPLDPRAEFFVTRSPVSVEGQPEARPGEKPEVALHVVGPDLFDVLGVEIEAGRDFDARDDAEGPSVAIVNRAFAERFWPEADPLGKRLTHDLVLLPDESAGPRTVVGVVSDFSYYRLDGVAEPQIYIPHAQTPWPQMHVVIRADTGLAALSTRLREILHEADGNVPAPELAPLSQVSGAVAAPRLRAVLLVGFSLTALTLAAIGLYGVLAFSVASRAREIGVRVALGARREQVVGLFVGEGMKLAALGVALGLAGALLSARLLSSLLYGVSTRDPLSYIAIVGVLLAVAFLASFVPALRATTVDPTEALRGDSG